MNPYYSNEGITIYNRDCIEVLKELPDNSIDTIITDPPYGLEFMGKEWDKFNTKKCWDKSGKSTVGLDNTPRFSGLDKKGLNLFQEFSFNWSKEALRVAKPGATLLCFGGARTFHRLACGLEDAGWIIKDCLMWIYSSGFPKSLNIGKAIDKLQGNKRIPYERQDFVARSNKKEQRKSQVPCGEKGKYTKGFTEWEGYGTALKPAYEPIITAMKPLDGTYAENALKWGVAGLNIQCGRIPFKNDADEKESKGKNQHSKYPNSVMRNPAPNGIYHKDKRPPEDYTATGRFPANFLLDEEAAKMLDKQSGESTTSKYKSGSIRHHSIWNSTKGKGIQCNAPDNYGDAGGASRFFYVAKASRKERGEFNNHPTVKPLKLIEYLVKLTSMPSKEQIYLDPFLGSGTTGISCASLGKNFIGIEQSKEYCDIAVRRIKNEFKNPKLF